MRTTVPVGVAALAALGSAALHAEPAAAQTATTEYCEMNYARADNMWGDETSAVKSLGWESIRLSPGQKRAFSTDWKYEKMRNDGTNYYGSHGRLVSNLGTRIAKVTYKPTAVTVRTVYIEPKRVSVSLKGDIVEIACP